MQKLTRSADKSTKIAWRGYIFMLT